MFNFYQNIFFITDHKQPVVEGNKSTTNGNWTLLPNSSGINFDLCLTYHRYGLHSRTKGNKTQILLIRLLSFHKPVL